MIKKILLTLGITLFSFVGFSYGITINKGIFGTGEIGGNLSYNPYIVGLEVGIDENLNFITNYNGLTKNLFTFYTDSTVFSSFYWGTGIIVNGYSKKFLNSGVRGGVLPYAFLCDTVNSSVWINNNDPTAFTNCTQIVNNYSIYENYLQYAKVGDEFIYGNILRSTSSENGLSPFLTINISELDKSITFYYQTFENSCISSIPCYNKSWNSSLPTTIANSYLFDTFPNDLIYVFSSSDNGRDIPENGFPNTNRGVFDAYAEQGYVLSRCYSDFSLDNLATATGGIYQFYETELDDGVYYTGATVLDLFVEYGYGNSFESFFDYWYQAYNQSLINDSPSKYVGLSKGLWNMSNKYYYAGLSNKYVDYTKFYNYCSYFVDFDGDWDSEYTGSQLPDDVSNQLAPSQSAIDYLSGFIHNQLSSGNNQNFDADTFFTSLTTKFDRLLNNINGSFIGIIPGYILAIMMALIFIRIISH